MGNKDWIGEDGQFYGSWDEWRGANNRYRQQQQQNTLLEEQNKLIRQQNEENARREKQERDRETSKRIQEKMESEREDIEYLENLLMCRIDLEEITSLKELKDVITIGIKDAYENLKYNIDRMVDIQKEIIKTNDNMWKKIQRESFGEEQRKYIKKINLLEDIIEERKKVNIDFCNKLYEELYNNIISYHKEEFRKVKQPVILKSNRPNIVKERERQKELILKELEVFKNIILEYKKIDQKRIDVLKKDKKEFENNIKNREEQIHKLEEITTLEDLKQIKEKVIDVDYEFSTEIINDVYSINEVVLKIKVHIKELEKGLLEEKKKEKYYKLLDYLINNTTYTNIQDYEEYNSNIDYEEEYKNVLNYEKEQKELEKEREIQEQKRLEEQKKLEELKKIEELKQEEEKKQKEDKKKVKVYEESKKNYKLIKWCIIFFYVCTLPLAITLWVYISSLAGIGGVIVCIIVGLVFSKIFDPKRKYLKDIKQFGFDNIEDFEKEVLDIKNNKRVK